ncbi:hypothetical protein GGQ74_002317 [Desulfobaculum xiamenense]|uniref:TIGR00299 family protein n=1 Tax=Desulfobaculum xiamenense TaxID=995050 RepID=A0A846QU05_9BACT|nr:LarC family nickel insertion protein [Desulfobaculum xiamenense]NJB68644.1 hypothetical protein [Desulfobaculum xiamenense]
MTMLYIDCGFGIAGDMFLAAAAGLGVDPAPVAEALRGAGIDVRVSAPVSRVNGFAGRRLAIDCEASQPLRHLPDIAGVIRRLRLNAEVRECAQRAFVRLAEVEAGVHGVPVDHVHFHEVGAVDTLVDVVGAFYALAELGVERTVCSPLPWFNGRVECAHGVLPLPAPATLELMRGKPVQPTDFGQEIVTPTGALIIDQVVDGFVAGPRGVVRSTATGFGTHDLGPDNRGLRLVLLDDWTGEERS